MPIVIYKNGQRSILSSGGQYDGEKMPGDLSGWTYFDVDSNDFLRSTYDTLSKRSMTLYHSYGPARAAINKQVAYAVGPGLVFRSQPDWQTLGMTKEFATDWGKEFQKIIHYYLLQFDFYDEQAILMRGSMAAGDSLLFFDRRQGIIHDLVEFGGDQIAWNYENDNYTLGVKTDAMRRPVGIMKTDNTPVNYKDAAGNINVIQYFKKELPRQVRGYPLVYSIINLAKNDDRHTDATAQRAVMESILLGTVESDGTDYAKQTENMATANIKKGTAYNGTSSGGVLSKIGNFFRLGPGNMYQVRTGEKMTFNDLKTPSNNFGPFKEAIVDYIGMATGTPPEVIMSKYNTSYTAHRGAFNDFEKIYMERRHNFIRKVMNPVITEVAKTAILNGDIEAPGFFENPRLRQAYLSGMFLGPVPGTINPLQEVNAEVKRVESGFILRSDAAARYGNEWDNFIDERSRQEEEYVNSSPEKRAEMIANQEANTDESN